MIKFKIKRNECRKLIEVIRAISNRNKGDFKTLIKLINGMNDLIDANKEYIDRFAKIMEARQTLIDVGTRKVSEYRGKLLESIENGEKVDAEKKKEFDSFQQMVVAQVNDELGNEIVPRIRQLDSELGSEEIEVELGDDKTKYIMEALESHGCEHESSELITKLYTILSSGQKEV